MFDDDSPYLKYALLAGAAYVVWKYVLPRVTGAAPNPLAPGASLQRRISEASLRQQYILDSIRDGQAAQAALPAGDPGISEIQGRIGILQGKLATLRSDFAGQSGGASVPVLDLSDPAMKTTYVSWLHAQGWKDPLVGVN